MHHYHPYAIIAAARRAGFTHACYSSDVVSFGFPNETRLIISFCHEKDIPRGHVNVYVPLAHPSQRLRAYYARCLVSAILAADDIDLGSYSAGEEAACAAGPRARY